MKLREGSLTALIISVFEWSAAAEEDMGGLSSVSISITSAVVYGVFGAIFFLLIFLLVLLGVTDCNWDCNR